MESELKNNMIMLNTYKHRLTKQQYKTFKGQILSGNYEGFRKGLLKVAMEKMKWKK